MNTPTAHRPQGAESAWWSPGSNDHSVRFEDLQTALLDPNRSGFVVENEHGSTFVSSGSVSYGHRPDSAKSRALIGVLPATPVQTLGDASFRSDHGIRYAYMTGAMANGIASESLVEAVSRSGMLGIFGSAGLSKDRVEKAIARFRTELSFAPYGINLIHSPNEQSLESALVDSYLRLGVRLVEASAYMDLTPHIVRYRLAGIHTNSEGQIVTPNRVIAKVSRVEVASRFMSPAPQKILQELVAQGALSNEQARMAEHVPIAQDVTAEADSGGHTDNRPAISLLPTILALRDRIQAQYRYTKHLRVGAAGGIATPSSAAAAFAMGASYVVTGSVNQSCVESGSSDAVRQMLAEAGQADTIMAPAADMFEMGVKVQVLKRGTMFAMRAARLYDLYRTYKSIEDIPTPERLSLEKTTFRAPLTEIWRQTEDYFHRIDPAQVAKARSDPHHQMALVFRWYLGLASRWANSGESGRQLDYQVWCGPSMGAFNEWVKGTHLEDFRQRHVAEIGRQIMLGAAICLRIAFLRIQGAFIPAEMGAIPVASSARLEEYVPEGLV